MTVETFRDFLISDPSGLRHTYQNTTALAAFLAMDDLASNSNTLWIGGRMNQNPNFDHLERVQNQHLANQRAGRSTGAGAPVDASVSLPESRREYHGSVFYDAWHTAVQTFYNLTLPCSTLDFQLAWNRVYNPIPRCWTQINTGVTKSRETVLHLFDTASLELGQFPTTPAGHTTFWFPTANGATTYDYIHIDNASSTLGLDRADARLLLATLLGGGWHRSSDVRGAPLTATGYTHDYARNRLIAVSTTSAANRTVTVVAEGDVSGGTHRFR